MTVFPTLVCGCYSPKQFLWDEDPYHNYEITDFKINTQFVKVFFIDIDKDVKTIGEEILDAKLPYDRINITTDEGFVITKNHMVGFCRASSVLLHTIN